MSRVAVNALRSAAPGIDGAIEGNAEDGVLRRFEKSCKQMLTEQTMRHGKRTVFQKGGMRWCREGVPAGERVEPTGRSSAANTVAALILQIYSLKHFAQCPQRYQFRQSVIFPETTSTCVEKRGVQGAISR